MFVPPWMMPASALRAHATPRRGGFLSAPLIRTPRKTNFCDFYCTLMPLWALTRALTHSSSGARERTTQVFRTASQRARALSQPASPRMRLAARASAAASCVRDATT